MTVIYSDLCSSCHEFADGLVAHWTYCVENALVNVARSFKSTDEAQRITDELWQREVASNNVKVGPPHVTVLNEAYSAQQGSSVVHDAAGVYYSDEHRIAIASFPVSDKLLLHEVGHALTLRSDEPAHGMNFVFNVFRLYADFGLIGEGVDPERLMASVGGFQGEAIDRTQCAFKQH